VSDTNTKPQRIAKEQKVAILNQLFLDSQAVIIADYRGLSVAEDTTLRRKMREADIKYLVSKNTLLNLACKDINAEFGNYLEGPTSVAFAKDPVVAAKILSEYLKKVKKGSIKAALLDNQLISAEKVEALAKLPSREVLLSQLLGAMQSPLTGFACCAAGILRQLVTVTDKIREQKEAQA